jgi:hypothetical protein
MRSQSKSKLMTCFQQLFAAFCVLMTETWFFLFFHVLASKFHSLLIMNPTSKIRNSNQIQTNFDSNVAIATFDHEPKQTFSNDLFLTCRDGIYAVRCGEVTNQIQREFLFNNGIQSQNLSSASKHPRQKTNLFKQRHAVTSRRRLYFSVPLFLCVKLCLLLLAEC